MIEQDFFDEMTDYLNTVINRMLAPTLATRRHPTRTHELHDHGELKRTEPHLTLRNHVR